MKLLYAIVCEHQRAGQRNTFDLLGVFDRIFSPNVPVQHRSLVFVVQLVTDEESDLGKHEFRLRIRRPTGAPLFDQVGVVTFRPEGGSWLASARLGFEFSGLILPDFGKYVLDLEVDGASVAAHPLMVVQQAPPAA